MLELIPNPQKFRDDPNVAILNYDDIVNRSDIHVEGTAQDLLRNGYDQPLPWTHNLHAQPDDRKMAFLVGRGWSANEDKRWKLDSFKVPWMAINDFPKDGPKPRYFVTGDPSNYFGERVWTDASIMKFTGMIWRNSIRPREDAYAPKHTPMDAPNTFFFNHCNNEVDYGSWLHVPWVTWGNTLWGKDTPDQFYKKGAARSSMLIGLRLLWHLGYREVYLLGCDCAGHHSPYPEYWNAIFDMLRQLAPTFRRYGYSVYQTNPDAHLRCFEFADFDEAVNKVHPNRKAAELASRMTPGVLA
jgi:hypothetical protein